MAEGLFDGRYRYDYIYPRGRSGETLRAYDKQQNNRPVVIKRPAPNDAPPIRAGQEVSILTERDALKRLAGHPVLTSLLDEGQFIVGGMSHRYIVMERGEGLIIADAVFELAENGERLPTLEMLVILDNLLDLLQTAHTRDIVYNDVDAKHLFWDRDNYRLKVIDWGNAVFLEGDEITPQGVSKRADIYQTGELLYFMLTGGRRADVPRDADTAWLVHFGDDAAELSPELARITSRALHPNPRHRYPTIAELRRELAGLRKTHEAERNAILARVNERLRRDRSRDELHNLQRVLQSALAMDPGYPASRDAADEIDARLNDLQISADLDAARIYLETANWRGAADILGELKGNARGETLKIIKLLFDWSVLLLEDQNNTHTNAIHKAIQQIFEGGWEDAAHTLIMAPYPDALTRRIHMRLAERITSHMPEVVLLRPNLYRLGEALASLDGVDGVRLAEQRELLDEINIMLDQMEPDTVDLVDLRDTYRGVVDRLSAMTTLMEAVNIGWGERRLPLSSLQRAQNAAMNLADNMHVIGKQAASTPREALGALDNSRAIDPTNPAWDGVRRLLDELYEQLQSYQTYVPVADGSDLAQWLDQTQRSIAPYTARLFDEMLIGMGNGLTIAAEQWAQYDTHAITGNRLGVLNVLAASSEAVGTISPTLAGWFNQLRSVVNGTNYIERHALSGGLGRTLADGWAAFDEGRLTDAERLAAQAAQIAKRDDHKAAVQRLRQLTEIVRGWTDRNGYLDATRTASASEAVKALYTEDETDTRRRFNQQMPSQDTYLKAMKKGLVEVYGMHSTAAQRILFADYVLHGALDAHDKAFGDVIFWREAAQVTLPDHAETHPAYTTLHELVLRLQDLLALTDDFNALGGPQTIAELDTLHDHFNQHPRARLIAEATHALREVENALPDWANAEFRTAGMKLEKAVKGAQATQAHHPIDLTPYIGWLTDLQGAAAQLHTYKRDLLDLVETRPDTPTDELSHIHRAMVDITIAQIGEPYTATLKLWHDTYQSFAAVMASNERRSAKLSAFNDLFRAMFIDRHPAYPIYRHWFDQTERAPEFPAPPTNDPQPRLTEDDPLPEADDTFTPRPQPDTPPRRPNKHGRRLRWAIAGLVGLAGLAVGGVAISQLTEPPSLAITISPTPTTSATDETDDAPVAIEPTTLPPSPTETPPPPPTAIRTENALVQATPTETLPPPTAPDATATPITTATPTNTPPPSQTPTPTNTPSPSQTPTPANTATPLVPPEGLRGEVDLLQIFERIQRENPTAVFWEPDRLSQEETGWRLGIGLETENDTLTLALPPELAIAYLGAEAPSRVQAVEATIALTTFNPALLGDETGDGVFFGMMLAPADSADPLANGAGLHIDVVQPGVVNIGGRQADDIDIISQRALNAVIARVRLERTADGRVQTFFNGQPLGIVGGNTSEDAPLLPVIYATDGGVILSVTEWRVFLR